MYKNVYTTMQVISRYDGQLLKQSHKTNNLSKNLILLFLNANCFAKVSRLEN